jgi:hypoxanthine-guanine phosphoribosyltransferase
MRTRSERMEARRDVMSGVDDRDVTLCQAILELCSTLDDVAERIAEQNDETRKAIDGLRDDLGRHAKQAAAAQ